MDTVTVKQFKAAFTAHNRRAEFPGANDNYNVARNLGTFRARCICRHIALHICGDGFARISLRDARHWAASLLPPGAGYASQDLHPWMQETVSYLRAQA